MKRHLMPWLTVVLIVLGGAGYYLYTHVESYTREINTGPTLEARFNPWLAAQNFLARHQINSHRAMDLPVMLQRLQPDDTLVLFNDSPVYDPGHQEYLQEWMRNGGHLILAANYTWDEEEQSSGDPFLDAMGVRLFWLETEDDDSDDVSDETTDETGSAESATAPEQEETSTDTETATTADASSDNPDAESTLPITPVCNVHLWGDLYQIHYAADTDPLQINFGYYYTLEDASQQAIRTADAAPNGLLQYAVGKGRMTVLLDTNIWTNRKIGDYDHAYLLWHLVQDSPTVWLVASHDSENLLALLWRTAPYLLTGCAVLLLLWGWRRWVRFGPLLPEPPTARRQLLEHIEASARFSWRHHQADALLATLRDDIWWHLNRHHGVQRNGDSNAALAKLTELSQLPGEVVRHAMTSPAPQREPHWIELISQLQTIRNAL
jgi:hypothetical protein